MEWELKKPITDLNVLRSRVIKTEIVLNDYLLDGSRNALAGISDFDKMFERLEEVHNGSRSYIMDGDVTMTNNNTGCLSLDDAKVFWKNFVIQFLNDINEHISNISKVEKDFSEYPLWVKQNCNFVVNNLYVYITEYLKKDPDLNDVIM